MAAHLKKRALAEFSHVIQEEPKPPPKKLRLVHRPKFVESQLELQNAATSHDALKALLRFEESLPLAEEHVEQYVRILLEHFYKETEAVVRAKVMMILGQLVLTPGYNPASGGLVDDLAAAIKREASHKVHSQMLSTMQAVALNLPSDKSCHQVIIGLAKQHLGSSSHLVRMKALDVLGSLGCPAACLRLVAAYSKDGDPRVRTNALNAMLSWHRRGCSLERSVYETACSALTDDCEAVRTASVKLVWVMSQTFSEHIVKVPESDEEIRLVDDGFARICNMVNDGCMRVRAEAAGLLGSLHGVGQKFLEQTLDKKLMSNMRKKTSAHERAKEHFASGEWSSGKKWADDAPKEAVEAAGVSLMSTGACGAFVHGFEDEYMEVRNPSIDSLCELATRSASFANLSQDFLVDMFNDEIESVRLNAINSLRKISHHIVLREDQLEIIMGVLKDSNFEIREALREMFVYVRMGTKGCLNACILGLIDNLKRYPQDRMSIWKCMQHLGRNHPALTTPMVPDLLSVHPYFECVEPDMDDPAYVSVLLLVFNAAGASGGSAMTALFPDHAARHYVYLRDTFPDMVPQLQLGSVVPAPRSTHAAPSLVGAGATPRDFLARTVACLDGLGAMDARLATQLINISIRDLQRVGEVDPALAATADCLAMYLQCQLALANVLSSSEWTSPAAAVLSTQQSSAAATASLVNKVLVLSYELEHVFVGLGVRPLLAVRQLRLRAQTLALLGLLRRDTAGAKPACIQYLQVLNNLQRSLSAHGVAPDAFTAALVGAMEALELCEPAVYLARLMAALRYHATTALTPTPGLLQRAHAHIVEPTGTSDSQLKFIAGLTAGVNMVVDVFNVHNIHDVRIQVLYPDQREHVVVPRLREFRQLSPLRHRLVTTVLLSHTLWSEACEVSLCVVLRYTPDREIAVTATGTPADRVVKLSCPVRLHVAPKPAKR